MAKEMIISSSAHEKKIAIVEDGIVTEYYVERSDESQGVAGNIYKGRVMKVLPGMQSAFVDIGLERDAFLYVSDFFEEEGIEEFEPVGEVKEIKEAREPREERREERRIEPSRPPFEERRQPVPPPVQQAAPQPVEEPPIEEMPVEETGEELPEPVAAAEEGEEDYDLALAADERAGEHFDEKELPRAESYPHSLLTSPASNFIRIQDEPETVEAVVEPLADEIEEPLPAASQDESSPVEAVVEAVAGEDPRLEAAPVAEEEVEPKGGKRRRGRKEAAKKKAPARKRGKKGNNVEETVSELIAQEPAPQPHFERVVDDETAEAGEQLKDAILQHRIVDEIRRSEFETPPFTPVQHVAEPEVRVGSLQSQWQADTGLERVVDEEAAAAAKTQGKPAESMPASEPASEIASEAPGYISGLPEESPAASEGESATGSTYNERREGGAEEPDLGDKTLSTDLSTDGGEPDGSDNLPSRASAQVRVPGRRGNFSSRRGGRRRGRRGSPPQQQPRPGAGEEGQPPDKAEASSKEPTNGGGGRHHQPGIAELLHEGQEIVVQIAKEPIAQKGARITSHIALPGRYLVYMPTVNHIGVSRKISSDTERLRLKKTILGLRDRERPAGGFIVRTACEGHTEQELHDDMLYLVRTWQDIRRKAERTKAPTLVYRELDLVQRMLRDQLTDDFTAIRVDNETEYARVVDFVNRFQPKLVKRVRLYTWKKPIFEEYGVQDELDKAIKPRVWLRSGGYIVINQTEALVAIDVNTGKFVGKSNRLEDTITKTNLEAVKEIVRQIRLRDLGGIIVLDFIDMEERKNRARVMQALEAELKADRSPSKILQFNDFGLVAITRKRVRQSLERTLCSPCPYCQGAGLVKSPQTVCYEILAEARRIAAEAEIHPGTDIILRINPEVAETLRGEEKKVLGEIEAHFGCAVTIKGDPTVHQERFDFAIM